MNFLKRGMILSGILMFDFNVGLAQPKSRCVTVLSEYETAGGVYSSAVRLANGQILVGSVDGNLYVFSSKGKVEKTIPLGGPIYATPLVLKNGTVIINAAGKVFALDKNLNKKIIYEFFYSHSLTHPVLINDNLIGFSAGTYPKEISLITPTGELKQTIKIDFEYVRSIFVDVDTLMLVDGDGRVVSLDPNGISKPILLGEEENSIWGRVTKLANDRYVIGNRYNGITFFSKNGAEKIIEIEGGVISTPVIDSDGNLIVSSSFGLNIFDKNDTLISITQQSGYNRSKPNFLSNGTIVVPGQAQSVYFYNPQGRLIGEFISDTTNRGGYSADPLVLADDTVVIGSSDYKIYFLKLEKGCVL